MSDTDLSKFEAQISKSFAELRPIAMRLALQLPNNRADAEIVVGLLADLIEWVHPRGYSGERNGEWEAGR